MVPLVLFAEGSVSADSAFSEATCSTSSSPMMCRESKSRKHGPQQSESGVYGESTTGSYTSYTTASCTDSSITQDSGEFSFFLPCAQPASCTSMFVVCGVASTCSALFYVCLRPV